jgi:ATP-dependent RNA helicase DHX57
VAARVADERGESKPGSASVGYVVRGDSAICKNTRLLFCTFGILLRQLQSEGALDCITHIVIDEVHERNLDGDVLMALLKQCLDTTPHLRVVLMSATLDADRFASYWGKNTPRMHIPGRTFPVDDYFLEDVLMLTGYNPPKKRKKKFYGGGGQQQQRPRKTTAWDDSEISDREDGEDGEEDEATKEQSSEEKNGQSRNNEVPLEEKVKRVDESHIDYDLLGQLVKCLIRENAMGNDGSILVFLPGAPEINQAKTAIGKITGGIPVLLLPLHGGLQPREQNIVFRPSQNGVKVILSTNVAETSITIPDCTVVIDGCREKQSSYDPINRMPLLIEVFASKASQKQRRGRAGRVQKGKCYKLISRDTHAKLHEHTAPEITRCALDQTLLSLLFLGVETGNGMFLGSLLDPPKQESVDAASQSLGKIGALEKHGDDELRLTPLGMHLAGIPAPPVVGKSKCQEYLCPSLSPKLTFFQCWLWVLSWAAVGPLWRWPLELVRGGRPFSALTLPGTITEAKSHFSNRRIELFWRSGQSFLSSLVTAITPCWQQHS